MYLEMKLTYMYIVFFKFGNVGLFAGGVWLRIHVSSASAPGRKEAKAYNPHNSLFAVAFPGSPYVIINKCGVRNLHLITEVGQFYLGHYTFWLCVWLLTILTHI